MVKLTLSAPNPDGSRNVTLDGPVSGVGIENIFDVASHEVTSESGAVSHLVRFRNGGFLSFLFTPDGNLMNLKMTDLQASFSGDNWILVRMAGAPDLLHSKTKD